MRLKLTLEYDGSEFRGWAAQPGERTVEAAVREALTAVFPQWDGLAIAGRTDTGVHALANVASVDVVGGPTPGRVAAGLNAALPNDVAVVDAAVAADDFHARFSASARTYRYRVWRSRTRSAFERNRSWWVSRALERDALDECARALIGEHDFRAFTPTDTRHAAFGRVVRGARWVEDGPVLAFEITADSFLRHMVRALVGTMIDGIDVRSLLAGRPRAEAGRTAPAHGLFLVGVAYDQAR